MNNTRYFKISLSKDNRSLSSISEKEYDSILNTFSNEDIFDYHRRYDSVGYSLIYKYVLYQKSSWYYLKLNLFKIDDVNKIILPYRFKDDLLKSVRNEKLNYLLND